MPFYNINRALLILKCLPYQCMQGCTACCRHQLCISKPDCCRRATNFDPLCCARQPCQNFDGLIQVKLTCLRALPSRKSLQSTHQEPCSISMGNLWHVAPKNGLVFYVFCPSWGAVIRPKMKTAKVHIWHCLLKFKHVLPLSQHSAMIWFVIEF